MKSPQTTLLKRTLVLLGGTALASALAIACAPAATPAATATTAAKAPTAAATSAATSAATAAGTAAAKTGASNAGSIRITAGIPSEAKQLSSGGATFPQPLYEKYVQEYNKLTGVQITYQATGSGAGRTGVIDGTFVIGGTDGLFTDANLETIRGKGWGNVIYTPTTLGAVGVAYNLPSLPATTPLRMSSDVVVGLFDGTIKKWNDPKIAADNPGVTLPNLDVIAINRSDSSGTTEIFTRYLSAVNPAWAQNVRFGGTVSWPAGATRLAGNGNAGVANEVKNNPGGVGYIEPAFAKTANLPLGSIRNRDGQFLQPTAETVAAGLANAAADVFPASLAGFPINSPGANSYPIPAVTWLAMVENQQDGPRAIAATRFLWWILTDGQAINSTVEGFYPLPTNKADLAITNLRTVKFNGTSVVEGWAR